MNDINVNVKTGRLVQDARLEYTSGGAAICTFSLAVNRSKKQQDGTWQNEASFFDCKIIGKLGESLHKYLVKGQQVSISGYDKQDRWVDKATGQNRYALKIMVEDIQLIGGKRDNSGASGNEGYGDSYGY